jgi:two-component system phosphate regulon sensor histidine kinase PhoR
VCRELVCGLARKPAAARALKVRIRLKLFLFSVGLIAVSVLAAELYLSRALERQFTERIRSDLIVRARLAAERAAASATALSEPESIHALADELAAAADARVTFVGMDGTVVGDSDVDLAGLLNIENHGSRPEIVDALAAGQGSSVRFSSTVSTAMMYAAVPVRRDGVAIGTARLALPLTDVDEAIGRMHASLLMGTLIALLVAVVASFMAARLTSRRLLEMADVARDMSGGNLAARTRAAGSDEIAVLGSALDRLAESLSRTVAELRAERDLLTGVLSGMNEGVLVIGAEGRIVLTNPALRAMLLIGADAIGKSALQVVRNADLSQLLGNAARGVPGEAELELTGLVQRRVLVRTVTLPEQEGGVLAVFVDVTALRRLESIRRDFVANASHELRSPLTTVRAAAETLRTMGDDRQAAERFVELIERNAERLANLIDDLLELSRIESRELELHLEELDLASVAERTISQHAHRARLKKIALSHDLAAAPRVRADPRAVEHILGNLVDNAIKYCPEGTQVRISAAAAESRVRVFVTDDGPGIAPQHQARIFERFYRVDTGRSRELGGTGLGLAIVKHLVEALGGAVSVESRPGAGSTFSFTLQRA